MVTPAGLEPATSRLEVSRSIQLSYGAIHFNPNKSLFNSDLGSKSIDLKSSQLPSKFNLLLTYS
jgi:hypothetical protein